MNINPLMSHPRIKLKISSWFHHIHTATQDVQKLRVRQIRCFTSLPSSKQQERRNDHNPPAGQHLSRNCLVTGGASGIGYEVTKRLVQDGASSVTITTRDAKKGEKTLERIKDDLNVQDVPIRIIETDFLNPDSITKLWTALFDDASKRVPVDTLINCAGLSQSKPLVATSTSQIRDVLQTNIEAPVKLSQLLLKEYLRLGTKTKSHKQISSILPTASFNIINISSLLATRSGSGASVYSASKAALIALTRTLVLEASEIRSNYPYLPPFRANTILPGYIDTPMVRDFSSLYKGQLEKQIPLRRFGSSVEVADAVMFLLRNGYANNTVLNLDGGLSAV
ncbi:hypothetical protein H2198_007800 [Neophaeococcomyces mojaviensis]|uniref:Uncharacterized protein n=1 Tax=Neophaeococcomyces mojaviensis TaxID=3383035 RepID=A0ACC2ZZ64_9EURO|nr:hypothetical protein H2198_007800 [Knufia sp. JES_112]